MGPTIFFENTRTHYSRAPQFQKQDQSLILKFFQNLKVSVAKRNMYQTEVQVSLVKQYRRLYFQDN